jgi:mono/diheme cytochrome c family protein
MASRVLCLFFLALNFLPVAADAATLTLGSGGRTLSYTTEELLARKDLVELQAKGDPAYGDNGPRFKAVKFASLFDDLPVKANEVLQFRALDGFSAPVARDRLLNSDEEKGSVAYVAVENPAHPWPEIPGKKASAGPFYLIWKNPARSGISPEEWPYQLAAFEVKGTLRVVYPGIFPYEREGKGRENTQVKRGFELFQKNCFSCHTLNACGSSQLGPDLNFPMNPFEYFQEKAIRKLVRDPKSVRKWPTSLMTGFSAEVLPDSDLEAILAYIKHMKARKSESCQAVK